MMTPFQPENTRLHLVFSLSIFLVEMTSFMFPSQYRDTQTIFYLLNTNMVVTSQAPFDARTCSWREWEALIGLRSNEENSPFDTENKLRYSQLLLVSFCLFYKGNRNLFIVFILPHEKTRRG